MDKVIYTVITENYDTLLEPTVITPGWDYYCFTNCKNLKSEVWQFIPIDYDDPQVLLSRRPKIRFFDHIKPEHNIALYIDANIQAQCDLNAFVEKALPSEYTMCALKHPGWDCTYREADAVKRMKKADATILDRQLKRYEDEGLPRNNGQIAANLLIYRNHNVLLREHCSHWWDEFSNPENVQRDQIGFNYILWKHRLIKLTTAPYETLGSNEFKWLPHG